MTKILLRGKQEYEFCDKEVSSYALDQLTNDTSAQQPLMIEDPSSDEEYLGCRSGSGSDDEACPKILVVEEAPTVE